MGKNNKKKLQNIEVVQVPKATPDTYKLTSIQKQILVLCAQGFSDSTIARKLGIEISTVRFHLIKIYNKFDIVNETTTVRRVLLVIKWLSLTCQLRKGFKSALDM